MKNDLSLIDLLEKIDIPKLAGLSFREQIYLLLSGKIGPLSEPGMPVYTDDEIMAAYLCRAAFSKRDGSGMLRSRPTYEIWELMGTRLQLALRRARGLHNLGVELYGPLGLDIMVVLQTEDRFWLRTKGGDTTGRRIAALRSKDSQTNILTAAQIMTSWFWDLRELTSTDPAGT